MQSDLLVIKKVNSELSSRLVNMECQYLANVQYSRRECLDVAGIPKDVEQKVIEGKELSVLEKVGCEIDPDSNEDTY